MLSSPRRSPKPGFRSPSPESFRCLIQRAVCSGHGENEDSYKWVRELPGLFVSVGILLFSCLPSPFPAPPFLLDAPDCVLEADGSGHTQDVVSISFFLRDVSALCDFAGHCFMLQIQVPPGICQEAFSQMGKGPLVFLDSPLERIPEVSGQVQGQEVRLLD